ncbi:MAG: CBS domain-containing protein [bacterium]
MIVSEIMSKCNSVSKKTSIREAERTFQMQEIKILPVTSNGKLVGVVTRGNIARALPSIATTLSKHEIAYWLDEIFVEEFMTKPVTVTPTMSLIDVVDLVIKTGLYNFPVVEEDCLSGMLYQKDIFNALFNIARTPLIRVEINGMECKICSQKSDTTASWRHKIKDFIKRKMKQ